MPRTSRVDPSDVQGARRSLSTTGRRSSRQDSGVRSFQESSGVKDNYPLFPDSRKCRDPFCVFLFLCMVGLMIFICVNTWSDAFKTMQENSKKAMAAELASAQDHEAMVGSTPLRSANKSSTNEHAKATEHADLNMPALSAAPTWMRAKAAAVHEHATMTYRRLSTATDQQEVDKWMGGLLRASIAGTVAAIIASCLFMVILQNCTACVIKFTLIIAPVVFLLCFGASGLATLMYMGTELMVPCLCSTGFFFLMLCLALCRAWAYWDLIPFTIIVTKAIIKVMKLHPSMFLLAFIFIGLSMVWLALAMGAMFGISMSAMVADEADKNTHLGILLLWFFGFVWGSLVAGSVPCVAYAGIFGRWFFNKVGNTVAQSLHAALLTSFGSVCFGSGIVAFVRTLELAARIAESDTDNAIVAIICCIVRCILACIGDMLEYFNAWAYIQCAVRNSGFMDSVRITFSMCTCANLNFIFEDVFVGWVMSWASFSAGIAGAAASALTAHQYAKGDIYWETASGSDSPPINALLIASSVLGLFLGLVISSPITEIAGTGTKTIMVLWAEDDQALNTVDGPLYEAFNDKWDNKKREMEEALRLAQEAEEAEERNNQNRS